jgi:hypothetical protein
LVSEKRFSAKIISTLLDLLQHQGKYDQAEPLYRRANENPAQGMGSRAG